jgi:hypothetical protein
MKPPRAAFAVCLLLVVAYGALLRLDALVSGYGAPAHPRWIAALCKAAPLARYVEPAAYRWPRIESPYVGGDPINYLRFAREMRSFYQAHVREPVFLALTRGWLALLGNQDIALSFASLTGSVVWIAATGLLGLVLAGPAAGIVAALALAIDYDAVTWAPNGWRDDTFAAFVTLTLWALVRLRQGPSTPRAITAGILAGLCALTRITAILFVFPALVWILFEIYPAPRRRVARVWLAGAVACVVIAPYLIACARATGDPLIAIDYHTEYYRHAENLPSAAPQSAAAYVVTKIARQPVNAIDTMLNGFFVHPFADKWRGYDAWVPRLTVILMIASVIGLALMTGWSDGRLTILAAIASVAPYALTWDVGGGGAWRFTMHVYSTLLVGAAVAITWFWNRRPISLRAVASCAVVLVIGTVAYWQLPWWVQRENLRDDGAVSLEAGARDDVFFRRGWSPPHRDGNNVTARVSLGARGEIDAPLPAEGNYFLTVRCDPVSPGNVREVALLWNGILLGRFPLAYDPTRVGAYRVMVPANITHRGANRLTLIPDPTVPPPPLGSEYKWLGDATAAGVRVWYVRLERVTG